MSDGMRYAAIDLRALSTDLPPVCDLYIRERESYVLYSDASLPFRLTDRTRLLAGGVSKLWIRISSEENLLPRRHLSKIIALSDQELPAVVKGGLLYCSAMTALKCSMVESASPPVVADLEEMVALTVDYLTLSQNAFPTLLSLMVHDASVYTHVLNVSVYALALAKFSGIHDRRVLRPLGVGAILHDVGKAKVPTAILQKPGPLSSAEWEIVRQHPQWGAEMLSTSPDLPQTSLDIVLQHHERLDGSGYPYGLTGGKVHQLSRLVALVDAYEAITGYRPYRPSLQPYEALALLKEEELGRMDGDLLATLVRLLGTVPKLTPVPTADKGPGSLC